MTAAKLELRDVWVRYSPDDSPVVRGLSMTLQPGERVALLGLNGAGKTSLLSTIVGLLPHDGEIEVAGVKVTRSTIAEIRRRVGFLFNAPEDQLLFPRVIDDVAFGLRQQRIPIDEATAGAARALAAVDSESLVNESVLRLSHGQKQRVALAGALVTEPSMLLLDEPSAALDPVGSRRLAQTLRSVEATVLVSTHDLDFAASCCDRFLLLGNGRVVLDAADLTDIRTRWSDLPAR
jgi:cobalt/nickel transport system ATP-binding protein